MVFLYTFFILFILYLYIIDFYINWIFLFCNSAFEQGHLDTWRYKNALIIIIIIIICIILFSLPHTSRSAAKTRPEVAPRGRSVHVRRALHPHRSPCWHRPPLVISYFRNASLSTNW